ncbi:Panacea domain-containing protein [Bartonella sp. CB60]|uniref:Panacea domain-containing protein n=1 Tax=Bartonella sp. CB60 TaxID=3113619 RepID=UPI00300E58C2
MSVQKPALYTVQQVANFFLDKGREENIPITQMKLIKIVYFAYGWVLAITGKRLFSEAIEAWKHGPVVSELYHEFKCWGNNPIEHGSRTCNDDTGKVYLKRIPPNEDNDIHKILDAVWDTYKEFSPWQLREKSHEKDSPWHKVYEEGEYNIQIEDYHIRCYFFKELGLAEELNRFC